MALNIESISRTRWLDRFDLVCFYNLIIIKLDCVWFNVCFPGPSSSTQRKHFRLCNFRLFGLGYSDFLLQALMLSGTFRHTKCYSPDSDRDNPSKEIDFEICQQNEISSYMAGCCCFRWTIRSWIAFVSSPHRSTSWFCAPTNWALSDRSSTGWLGSDVGFVWFNFGQIWFNLVQLRFSRRWADGSNGFQTADKEFEMI